MKKYNLIIAAILFLLVFVKTAVMAQPEIPKTLGQLSNFDLSFTDLSNNFDIKASVPLFTVQASRKNHNVVLNFLKYKDVLIDGVNVRVFVGMQLFITSYDYSYSGSISPAAISAAATLGKTKATFDLKIYGLPIDYSKLPKTGSFNGDTFGQIQKVFDDILTALTDATPVSPMIVKLPPTDNTAIFKTMNFADLGGVATPDKKFDSGKVKTLM